jgi:hypothetical protein
LKRREGSGSTGRFFMIRATRIWNHIVDELNLNTDSLSSFKSKCLSIILSMLRILVV